MNMIYLKNAINWPVSHTNRQISF